MVGKMANQKYIQHNKRNSSHYAYDKNKQIYCNKCGKQMLLKDSHKVVDPKGVLKYLTLCETCYSKKDKDF